MLTSWIAEKCWVNSQKECLILCFRNTRCAYKGHQSASSTGSNTIQENNAAWAQTWMQDEISVLSVFICEVIKAHDKKGWKGLGQPWKRQCLLHQSHMSPFIPHYHQLTPRSRYLKLSAITYACMCVHTHTSTHTGTRVHTHACLFYVSATPCWNIPSLTSLLS